MEIDSKIENKLGKFKISRSLILENPSFIRRIMSKMIIVRAEMLWSYDVIEYEAMCNLFDEVLKGIMIPEYNLDVTSKNGYLKYKFNRVD